MSAVPIAQRPPRRHLADLVLALADAGIALERLERQRRDLTGPGQLVGIMDLRPAYDACNARARKLLGCFADHRTVEDPGRAGDTIAPAVPPLSGAPGVPERRDPIDVGCPELAEGQIWLSCYAGDRWKVEQLNPCPGEGATAIICALDGPHQGKRIPVRVGEVRDQALLIEDPPREAAA